MLNYKLTMKYADINNFSTIMTIFSNWFHDLHILVIIYMSVLLSWFNSPDFWWGAEGVGVKEMERKKH